MDCPFLNWPGTSDLNQPVCDNSMHNVATHSCGLFIPVFMQHMIQRPLQHMPLPGGGNSVQGYVIMEFNHQIFRREILVVIEQKCHTCGRKTSRADLKDRYADAVQAAVRLLSRDVNKAVKVLLDTAREEMERHA